MGREGEVRELIDGANLECKDDENGGTPLCWAAMLGRTAIARMLLDAAANKEAADQVRSFALPRAREHPGSAVARGGAPRAA